MLTFDLKVKFIWFMTRLCVQVTAFLSFGKVILCLTCECITMVWCVTCGKIVFALWHRHTKFWGDQGTVRIRGYSLTLAAVVEFYLFSYGPVYRYYIQIWFLLIRTQYRVSYPLVIVKALQVCLLFRVFNAFALSLLSHLEKGHAVNLLNSLNLKIWLKVA